MPMRYTRILSAILLTVLVVGCTQRAFWTTVGLGTVAAAAGAAVYYVQGDLEADLDHELDRVHRATEQAATARGYTISESTANALNARVVALIPQSDGDTREVTINMRRTEDDVTHVSIRVGLMGDEALSRAILRDIESRLGPATTPAQ